MLVGKPPFVPAWKVLFNMPKAMHHAPRHPLTDGSVDMATKPGLYANIHAKQERIKARAKEKMRKPNSKGAPTDKAFKQSAKTAKK